MGQNGRNNINTSYSNEYNKDPLSGKKPGERGMQIYTLSQIMKLSGRGKDGELLTWGFDTPYFYLTVSQRIELAKLCSPVFGIVTSRMNRISGMDFNISPVNKDEDRYASDMRDAKQQYSELALSREVPHILTKARIVRELKQNLPDLLPDLSNFDNALVRWKKRIQSKQYDKGNEIKAWLLEPNQGLTWDGWVKKVVFDLHVHGACATYKQSVKDRLENFDTLPGGSVYKLRTPTFSTAEVYAQVVMGFEPGIYYNDEIMYMEYYPISSQSHSMIPLEALINKVCETMLFDKLMAEQADGTKPPEKMVIVTNPAQPFGDFDATRNGEQEVPLDPNEQKRIETKVNEPRKGAIITFTGNKAEVIDLSRENTMAMQSQRQKDIREEVALVFNMSNMEVNLTGSGDTSGRSTSETQQEIEQGKGIAPLLKILQSKVTKEIINMRYGYGYKMEYSYSVNEKEQRELDSKKLQNGEVTINELREKYNLPPFEGQQFNLPSQTTVPAPGSDAASPLFTSPV
jgi:hypothetical protein